MHPVPAVAELTKIIENAHRYLQIAFAEDLYLYCQANKINFAELRDSLNTKWNVNILEPSLPKDTMFLNSSRSIRSRILSAVMDVDKDYRKYMFSRDERKLVKILPPMTRSTYNANHCKLVSKVFSCLAKVCEM
jgi:UDP-N-acetyl-D-mannosaminuronate dehydrogenase